MAIYSDQLTQIYCFLSLCSTYSIVFHWIELIFAMTIRLDLRRLDRRHGFFVPSLDLHQIDTIALVHPDGITLISGRIVALLGRHLAAQRRAVALFRARIRVFARTAPPGLHQGGEDSECWEACASDTGVELDETPCPAIFVIPCGAYVSKSPLEAEGCLFGVGLTGEIDGA